MSEGDDRSHEQSSSRPLIAKVSDEADLISVDLSQPLQQILPIDGDLDRVRACLTSLPEVRDGRALLLAAPNALWLYEPGDIVERQLKPAVTVRVRQSEEGTILEISGTGAWMTERGRPIERRMIGMALALILGLLALSSLIPGVGLDVFFGGLLGIALGTGLATLAFLVLRKKHRVERLRLVGLVHRAVQPILRSQTPSPYRG